MTQIDGSRHLTTIEKIVYAGIQRALLDLAVAQIPLIDDPGQIGATMEQLRTELERLFKGQVLKPCSGLWWMKVRIGQK
jgi:hypothetical protein